MRFVLSDLALLGIAQRPPHTLDELRHVRGLDERNARGPWVSQLAREARIDTGILATRADLVELLRGDPDARLARGWRADVVGDDIGHLVSGDAALAFDGKGGLRLINLH